MESGVKKVIGWIKNHKAQIAGVLCGIEFVFFIFMLFQMSMTISIPAETTIPTHNETSSMKLEILDVSKFAITTTLSILSFIVSAITLYLSCKWHKENQRETASREMYKSINTDKLKVVGHIPLSNEKSNEKDLLLTLTTKENIAIFPDNYVIKSFKIQFDGFRADNPPYRYEYNNKEILIYFTERNCIEEEKEHLFIFLADIFYCKQKERNLSELCLNIAIEYRNNNEKRAKPYSFTGKFILRPISAIDKMGYFELDLIKIN